LKVSRYAFLSRFAHGFSQFLILPRNTVASRKNRLIDGRGAIFEAPLIFEYGFSIAYFKYLLPSEEMILKGSAIILVVNN